MEIEVEDRSKLVVEKGQKAVFGRGNGFNTTDPTVSRRQVLLELEHRNANQTEPRISFEVLGRNPIWVRSHKEGEVRVFRRSEKGELAAGDWLCVSGKRPIWFKVRNIEEEEEDKRISESESELAKGLINGSEWEGADVSGIDPVKEFGFIVMGHEFDQYPKQMIRDIKNWDWFLEEPRKESDDDEYEGKGRRGGRRKRKKGEEDDNEEWTGDSEVDAEFVAKLRKVNKPKYSTRSKAHNEPQKKAKGSKSSVQKMTSAADEEGIDDDDDETLGGFIVGEDGLEDEEDPDGTDEFEEEEEFVEEDDDDE
ncbi:PREDICTED: ABC transporter F family member 4 [Fragaria vesca subsp. vesca]|uniref:ABC transporter F family member 4 n=1 Tax=Fragaria vesca subsp. vesca TaxID=101020 RepID=UPI0002C33A20|nr:PREDICTED: ABC transporter F family member 4 [Fragaria vesca subsp. vesca]